MICHSNMKKLFIIYVIYFVVVYAILTGLNAPVGNPLLKGF